MWTPAEGEGILLFLFSLVFWLKLTFSSSICLWREKFQVPLKSLFHFPLLGQMAATGMCMAEIEEMVWGERCILLPHGTIPIRLASMENVFIKSIYLSLVSPGSALKQSIFLTTRAFFFTDSPHHALTLLILIALLAHYTNQKKCIIGKWATLFS